jgi:hypothetical protein
VSKKFILMHKLYSAKKTGLNLQWLLVMLRGLQLQALNFYLLRAGPSLSFREIAQSLPIEFLQVFFLINF